jgi:hypothetical protein
MRHASIVSLAIAGALLLPVLPASARPWKGLNPGQSTLQDVQKAFGQPNQELKNHGHCALLYNYQAAHAVNGTKQTNVCFNDKNIVVEIAVFPDRALTKELVDEAYGKVYQKKLTDDFREYHLYKNEGLAIFFEKDGNNVQSLLFTAAGAVDKK